MESTSKLVNVTRQKDATTYNMAVTNSTSLNNIVDLFFIAGASRRMSENDIIGMLERSWAEDQLLTLKLVFWAGDVRGGAGERRFFRIALAWLKRHYAEQFSKNFKLVPEFNRWDSLFAFPEEQVLCFIEKALTEDKNGLLAKWMPRKKQYNNFASVFRKRFGLDFKEYRKWLVQLSKTVEQRMCCSEWKAIEYKHVPSVAMNKYRKAFLKRDPERFKIFISKVEKGEEKIHADAIFPYDIYRSIKRGGDEASINAQWSALPDYMAESGERILPVCDVSGSMYGLPLDISVSLGLYLSERNKSIFKNAFVTFSGHPKMEYLEGTLAQRSRQIETSHWEMNTNLNKVFSLILNRAVAEKLSHEDMPTMILIISDMEFDQCGELTNYGNIERKYNEAGYLIPKIVFWNVNGRAGNVPVSQRTKNVALVSGASPAIMKGILGGKDFTPRGVMLTTLGNERYESVVL